MNTGRTFDAARGILRTQGVPGRRVRRLGRAHPARRVRQERQRQPARRRLRHDRPADSEGHRRAVRLLAAATSTCAASSGALGTLNQTTIGVRVAGKLPARLDYGVEMAVQRGSLGPTTRSARGPATGRCANRCPGRGAVKLTSRIQLRVRRREPDRRHPRHVRSALSDRPRQAGAGRSGRLANIHHLREGVEFTPVKATPIIGELSLVVAGREDATASTRRAARCSRASPAARPVGHVGQEIDVQVTRAAHAAAAARGRLRAHASPARS